MSVADVIKHNVFSSAVVGEHQQGLNGFREPFCLFTISLLFTQYNVILSKMSEIYSTAKVCPKPDECWSLEPGEWVSSCNYSYNCNIMLIVKINEGTLREDGITS